MGDDGIGIPLMMGGCGESSYFRNSTYQERSPSKFDISPKDSNVIRIADLGCSVGPNTFYVVQSIIDAMCSTPSISQLAPAVPEFQVFFNDQMGNDFNMLFNSLPLLDCRYFVAGVPGSFYERIFPGASIHFFNSALALHWLSKAPVGAIPLEAPVTMTMGTCTPRDTSVCACSTVETALMPILLGFLQSCIHKIKTYMP
ncbi:putative S-adenosylmethionine-dependent methyltransferase [Nymphaea thermarum]|nr:putative S-adenosylmethionine-dependent methyltransferase [Nymphaea thermarum]